MFKQYAAEYSEPALETRHDEYEAWGEKLNRQMTEKLTANREAQTKADTTDKTELEKTRLDFRTTKEYAAFKKLSETYGYCEKTALTVAGRPESENIRVETEAGRAQ